MPNDIRHELLELIRLNKAEHWVPEYIAFRQLDRYGDRLIPGLIECLGDGDSEVRRLAVQLLSEGRPRSDVAVPALVESLTDDDRLVRYSAVWSLMEFGDVARSAAPALKRLLDDYSEPYIRISAAGAISRIAPEDSAALPVLLEGLSDTSANHRAEACEFLGGVRDTSVSLLFLPLLGDADMCVRFAAAQAMGKLVGEWFHAVVVCVDQLKDADEYVRCMGRENLMSLDSHAKAAAPRLKPALKTVPWAVRIDIEEVLWELQYEHGS